MNEVFEWTNQHGFLTWCALWLVWGFIALAFAACELSFKMVNRILRTVKVCVRGWPPPHLDADGDWRVEPELPEVKGISEAANTLSGAGATDEHQRHN